MRHVTLDSGKRTYIDAFFQYHRQRAERLLQLWEQGHQDDALTLCCCYLDGLAKFAYHPSGRSAYNFVALLREHGAQPALALCSPLALVRWMERQGGWRAIAGKRLRPRLDVSITKLFREDDLKALLRTHLSSKDSQRLARDTWRSSVAYIAYERLRNPFVHELGGPGCSHRRQRYRQRAGSLNRLLCSPSRAHERYGLLRVRLANNRPVVRA